MKDNRILGIGLALAAAACLIYASVTRHWLVNSSRFERSGTRSFTFGMMYRQMSSTRSLPLADGCNARS